MADGKATLWYSCFISDIDDHDLSMIRSDLQLSDAYELRVPTAHEHSANPPAGFMTVFRDQLLGEAAMLRAYSSDAKRRTVSYLKALSTELKHGLTSSSRSSPSASRSAPSASQPVPPASAQEETSSVIPLGVAPVEDLAAVEQVDLATEEQAEEERAASPPPAKRLKLQRKRKKVTPATQASPPPLPSGRRSSVISQSLGTRIVTPDRETALGPVVPTLSPRTSTPTPGRVATPEPASFPAQTSSPGPLPPPLMDQPGSSATLSASIPLSASASTPRSRRKTPKKYTFTDSWCLPSSTESGAAEETAEEVPPPVALVEREGDLATSWRSSNQKFWKNPPMEGLDQAARQMVSVCSANLSVIQYASRLQKENEVLKARLHELELPLTPPDPLNPTPGDLASYLRLIGEFAESARRISHVAFDKIKTLEATLKTSESRLASEAERRRALAAELDEKDARLASLQETHETLQKTLTEVQGQLVSSADREKTFQSQWEASQAALKSMQADLLKAQENVF
ncbi:uncharacterized protein LOC122014116 [Zingiber officinale]|uniref:uncharacterized protein LOC122014116 n=1 Tax=Zingiber officinale TaxID=94328 RepID=UPI001C4B8D3F|nr:uncharacterized protein LOC122014116 [Zingiber officinale]